MEIYRANFFLFSLLGLMSISPLSSISQEHLRSSNSVESNYSKFKSEFAKEFGIENAIELQKKNSNITRVFLKTKLPEWVFILPPSNDSIVYAIGVSDPGMDEGPAFQLACLRSKAVLAILTKSTLDGLTDYYINEKELKSGDIISSVYKEFNKLKGELSFNPSDFTIVEETYTANNEAIVLSSLRLNKKLSVDSITIRCMAEISGSHIKKNNKYSSASVIQLMAEEQNFSKNLYNNFYYAVKNSNKKILILSEFSGSSLYTNAHFMSYQSSNIKDDTNEDTGYSYTLQHGLWHAYSALLLQTLVVDLNESYTEQSGLSDDYTKLSQNINRVLSQKEISLRICGFRIQNNTLYLESVF